MITDFLKTDKPKEDLAIALAVLRHFKECHSMYEDLSAPLMCWTKLEQLEEFLAYKVEGTPLREDTVEYMGGYAALEATL